MVHMFNREVLLRCQASKEKATSQSFWLYIYEISFHLIGYFMCFLIYMYKLIDFKNIVHLCLLVSVLYLVKTACNFFIILLKTCLQEAHDKSRSVTKAPAMKGGMLHLGCMMWLSSI
ncbi:uncharacterized protein DS421_12g367200 [Arachis hypogaea]|nr:uncharacterized protein DS421_12g367200 [Arachis hypogaea]